MNGFQGDFDSANQFVLTISAPPGKKFFVRPLSGQVARFTGSIIWQAVGVAGPSRFGTISVAFSDVEGAAPSFAASRTVLSDTHTFAGFNDIQSTGFTNEFAFTAITLTATVPQANIGVGTMNYLPMTDTRFGVFCPAAPGIDPGPFVSLVPTADSTNGGGCTFSLSATNREHGFGAESGTVVVATQPECAWGVVNTTPWITVTSSLANTNNGTVTYTIASNSLGATRSGFITIAGKNFVVRQAAAPASGPGTITFDNLSSGMGGVGMPDGYAGLRWNNFGVYCGSCRPVTEGYRVGTVSPTNVAFNFFGDPASISSTNKFNLHSAFLTAAWNLDLALQVQVEGFLGTTQLYSNTYTLRRDAPSFVRFDYVGVDQVRFSAVPSGWFAIDDLAITLATTSNCTFFTVPGGRVHGFGSETGSVALVTQPGCPWSVLNTNPWVTILTPLARTGDGTVTYEVAANPLPDARRGFINIADQNFAVSQAGVLPPPVAIGPIEVSTIGRTLSMPQLHPFPMFPASLRHFLIDQSQSSGGGAALPNVSVNWDTNIQFTVAVRAPPGQKFLVQVPPGNSVSFVGFLWWESTRGGFSPASPVSATFEGLEGVPPDFLGSDAVLSSSHGFFGISEVTSAPTTTDFAFTSVTFAATVLQQTTGNGTENYVPHQESSLQLVFIAADGALPGGQVSLVLADPPQPLRFAGLAPNANPVLTLRGRDGRTNVVECSEDLIHWRSIATNALPATFIDPTGSGVPHRFYRSIELP